MSYVSPIPTRQNVKAAWHKYQALCLLVASDHNMVEDPAQQAALANAHARWAKLFSEWDGR